VTAVTTVGKVILAAFLASLWAAAPARAADDTAVAGGRLEITTREREGLGCILGSGVTGTATVLFSGTALVVSAPGVAATAIAVPVLVATMAAGCSIGAVAAPGVAWVARQHGRVAELVDGLLLRMEDLAAKWDKLPSAKPADGAR
jgi:hypothetical protein